MTFSKILTIVRAENKVNSEIESSFLAKDFLQSKRHVRIERKSSNLVKSSS